MALSAIDPQRVTARVVRDALEAVGHRTDRFTLAHAGAPLADQVNETVRSIRPPVRTHVRTIKRWGGHPEGVVISTDPESARWAISKGYAVPVEMAG
jgi:hypothetical protein